MNLKLQYLNAARRLWMLSFLIASLLSVACSRSAFDAFAPLTPAVAPELDTNLVSSEKSTMTINYWQVADGMTPAEVNLVFRNFKGEPLENVLMSLHVSGSGNVLIACSSSDSVGRSRCRFYSTTAEQKIVKIVGAVTMTAMTLFQAPQPSSSAFAVVSSSGDEELVAGPRLVASSGIVESDAAVRDSYGIVRIYSSILGSVIGD